MVTVLSCQTEQCFCSKQRVARGAAAASSTQSKCSPRGSSTTRYSMNACSFVDPRLEAMMSREGRRGYPKVVAYVYSQQFYRVRGSRKYFATWSDSFGKESRDGKHLQVLSWHIILPVFLAKHLCVMKMYHCSAVLKRHGHHGYKKITLNLIDPLIFILHLRNLPKFT